MENEFNQEEEVLQEELSFSDKIVGVVTNPASILDRLQNLNLKPPTGYCRL